MPARLQEGDGFHLILDAAPDAMLVIGEDARILFVNQQTEKLFGYPRAELLGKTLDVLIPERFRPTHGGHVRRYLAAPSVRPMGSGLELYGRRADGSEVPIEVSLSPVQSRGGTMISAALRDITERKRYELEAHRNADRLERAIESIQDALGLYDANGHLMLCNSVYRRLMGEASPGAMVGRAYRDVVAASLHGATVQSGSEDITGTMLITNPLETRGACDVVTADGRTLRVMNSRTLDGGFVQTIWDLTDDARREQGLRQARADAEASSAAKSEFLSSMSHELRTPLNAILGFAQLLQRSRTDPLSNQHKSRVEHILKGGEHLLRLINDILDLSHIESGGISMSPEPVDVLAVLDEVRLTLQPMAESHLVRLGVETAGPSLPAVLADRTRFAQILMNFGSNAIKYNRKDGCVVFRVSAVDPASVRVAVVDKGIGIPADKQHMLFQPFQRAGQETGPIEGSGIGLVVTRRLAELMGGRVGFASEPGEGSEFWVEMPAHSEAASRPPPVAAGRAPSQPVQGSLQRPLVLYVEDNEANTIFMRDLLDAYDGVELVTTQTAEQGIECARLRQPSVVIMDINLPGMSGLQALTTLRASPETRRIPVIALTAAASERDKQRGEQAGFFRYLTKPVRVDELEEALDSVLRSPRS